MSTSTELFEKQRHYDLLHHQKRIFDLCEKKHLNRLERDLLEQSKSILENPLLGTHSVDLSDTEYLLELDTFKQCEQHQ